MIWAVMLSWIHDTRMMTWIRDRGSNSRSLTINTWAKGWKRVMMMGRDVMWRRRRMRRKRMRVEAGDASLRISQFWVTTRQSETEAEKEATRQEALSLSISNDEKREGRRERWGGGEGCSRGRCFPNRGKDVSRGSPSVWLLSVGQSPSTSCLWCRENEKGLLLVFLLDSLLDSFLVENAQSTCSSFLVTVSLYVKSHPKPIHANTDPFSGAGKSDKDKS